MHRPLVVGVLVAALAAAATPVAAQDEEDVGAFADGYWSLSLTAAVDISGTMEGGVSLSGRNVYSGFGSLVVEGGAVSGAHEGSGSGTSHVEVEGGSGDGTLNFAVSGEAAGTAVNPRLVGNVQVTGSMSITTEDLGSLSVPLDISSPLGVDENGMPLTIFTATCNRVTGDWTLEARDFLGGFGITVGGPSSFVAIRTEAASADDATRGLTDEVADVGVDAAVLIADFRASGDLDVGALLGLLDRAETLAARLPAIRECASPELGGAYSTILGTYVRQLVEAGLDAGDRLDVADLLTMARAGYRTGAVAGDLADRLIAAVGAHLDTAIAANDDFTILVIAVNASILGWDDLHARAVAAL